jgi:photosystem II stability/assembly factor-like uncharacterized protein
LILHNRTSISWSGYLDESLKFSPEFSSDGTVFVTSNYSGVLKSTDRGDNWTVVNAETGEGTAVIAVSPGYASDNTVFVGQMVGAGHNAGGVLKTVDGGGNWSVVNDGLNALNAIDMAVSQEQTETGTLFVINSTMDLYKSTDGGASWSVVYQSTSNKSSRCVEMSPSYSSDQTVFIADGLDLYKSTDGVQSWSNTGLSLTSDDYTIRTVVLSPDYASDHTVFVGTDGRVYKTTDGGGTWNTADAGISADSSNKRKIVDIVMSPDYSSDNTAFLARGATSGPEIYKTSDGGASWSRMFYGTNVMSIHNLAISKTYATDHTVCASLVGGGVYKTTDGGNSWNTFNTGISDTNVYTVAISPDYHNDQTLYAGHNCGDVLKSGNGGNTWNSKSEGMYNPCGKKFCFSADYANDRIVYAANSGQGVYVMTDAQTGDPELTHYFWDEWMTGGDCGVCHRTPQTFLQAGYTDTNANCYTCHNPAATAHELVLAGNGHDVMASITSAGITQPAYGNITSGELDNRMYANLLDDKVGCITCHNVMDKYEDVGRTWEFTTTSDNKTYNLQNGEWSMSGYYVPKVYRDSSLWTGPTYVKDKKDYLVNPSEYTFNEYSGTVTFNQEQDPSDYVYVTLDYPYLRASSENNRLCSDCHSQATHMNVNCLTCHTAHNTDNIDVVRQTVRTSDRTELPVVFLRYSGANSFADGDTTYDGICEVCHTQTLYHKRDGSGASHYDGGDCTTCHSHASGFARYD